MSCPVCGRSIHHALINTHLDSCQVDDAAQKVHQQAPVELKAASNGSASHSTSSTAGARLTQQGSQASSGARAGQLWPVFQQEGKSRPGRTAAATAHYPDGRQRQLTAEQLFGITPCELVPAALPASLATEVGACIGCWRLPCIAAIYIHTSPIPSHTAEEHSPSYPSPSLTHPYITLSLRAPSPTLQPCPAGGLP